MFIFTLNTKTYLLLLSYFNFRNPKNTIFDAKRLIGRKFGDQTVQTDMKHWPFKVINKGGKPVLQAEYMG